MTQREEQLKIKFLGLLMTQIDHIILTREINKKEILATLRGYKAILSRTKNQEEKGIIIAIELLTQRIPQVNDAFIETLISLRDELLSELKP